MAQDFGDDMGNALLNFVTRQAENYLRFGRGRERAFDWWQRHYKKEGNTPEQAKAMAEKQRFTRPKHVSTLLRAIVRAIAARQASRARRQATRAPCPSTRIRCGRRHPPACSAFP